jgi:hypothetical protein
MSTAFKKHYKAPFPALNVHRREEALATDTVYSDVPAVDSGVTIAQLVVGLTSTVCDVHPLKTEKAFVTTLQDVIRRCGAPSKTTESRISSVPSSLAIGRVNPINNIRIRMANGWRTLLWTALDRPHKPGSLRKRCLKLYCLRIPQLAHTNGNTDWFHTRYQPSSQLSMVGTCVL